MVGKFRDIVLNAWAFKKKVSLDQELLENKRRKKFDYACQRPFGKLVYTV